MYSLKFGFSFLYHHQNSADRIENNELCSKIRLLMKSEYIFLSQKFKELMNKYRHLRLISFVLNLLSRIYVRSNETGAYAYQDICIYHPTYTLILFDSTKCIENNKKYLNTYTKKYKYCMIYAPACADLRDHNAPHTIPILFMDIALDEYMVSQQTNEDKVRFIHV